MVNLINSIYQEYCDSTKESPFMDEEERIKDRDLQEICTQEQIEKLENIILRYRSASDAEKFADGFRWAFLFCMQCLVGDCYE